MPYIFICSAVAKKDLYMVCLHLVTSCVYFFLIGYISNHDMDIHISCMPSKMQSRSIVSLMAQTNSEGGLACNASQVWMHHVFETTFVNLTHPKIKEKINVRVHMLWATWLSDILSNKQRKATDDRWWRSNSKFYFIFDHEMIKLNCSIKRGSCISTL